MDVCPGMLPIYVELDPWFDGTVLIIDEDCANDEATWDKIEMCVVHSYRWLNWSETRWCRVTHSSKYMLRSMAMGSDAAARQVLEDATVSNLWLPNAVEETRRGAHPERAGGWSPEHWWKPNSRRWTRCLGRRALGKT